MADTHHNTEPTGKAPQVPNSSTDLAALARLLDQWMQDDAVEQRETFEVLRQSLDEHRPKGYKIFP